MTFARDQTAMQEPPCRCVIQIAAKPGNVFSHLRKNQCAIQGRNPMPGNAAIRPLVIEEIFLRHIKTVQACWRNQLRSQLKRWQPGICPFLIYAAKHFFFNSRIKPDVSSRIFKACMRMRQITGNICAAPNRTQLAFCDRWQCRQNRHKQEYRKTQHEPKLTRGNGHAIHLSTNFP